ncbi:MAG: malate dehydrogenase [Coxiella sp. RIFCSPHIGHO2_12_FULL_42_15]|nr:MAG: malate dehydrogenase [Coxiella sp. RIFCSPHIGHO2_12_FULL_42_15]
MSQQHVKVAVTGAAGNIGYALMFRIASGQVFGPDVTMDLHLLEIEPALPTLEGVVMELHDCAFPLLRNIVISSDPNVAFKGVNWAILVGAVPRKAGMERSDLLKINGGIFVPQGKAINDHAADDVRVFVVGNPCNTNCLIAMHSAPDVSKNRFYAMTSLDENRARSQLAIKAGVLLTEVKNMIVWGNHSSLQYPDFYHATIKGQSATKIIDEKWLQNEFIPMIQQRGATVIKARGASSAASAANAAINGVQRLLNDTPSDNSYSMSLCSQGQYDIDPGLIFSFPCRTEKGRIVVLEDFKHNAFAKQQLQKVLEELRTERDAVKELKLIS